MGNLTQETEWFEAMVEKHPDDPFYQSMGLIFKKQKEYQTELDLLRQFVVDMNSCKHEPDKMLIIAEREYQRNRELYKTIKPFDCN